VTDARSLNTCPVWLPESRALLFVSNRDGNRDIYRVDLDASGRPAGEPDRLTTGLSMHSFSVSVGGDRLVYAIFAYTANIWTVDVPERGPVSAAAATPFTQGTQVIESMSLSPDGRWLAFDSDRNGNQDVYKLSVEGGVPVQLTNSPRTSSSPPGRATVGRSQGIRITAAPDGCSSSRPRAVSPVTSPVAAQSAITRLLAGRKAARLHLRCVGAASALPGVPKRERLVGRATAAHIERGVGGPVGARRARDRILPARGCVAHRPGRRPAEAIGRCRARRLAGTGARAVEPDGRTIYYKAFNAAGHSSLWSVAASGGPPRLLVRFDDPSRPSSRPEFTTDGRRFYFTVTERLSDIWSMELRRE
jgi:Tol biopolymer transport system component